MKEWSRTCWRNGPGSGEDMEAVIITIAEDWNGWHGAIKQPEGLRDLSDFRITFLARQYLHGFLISDTAAPRFQCLSIEMSNSTASKHLLLEFATGVNIYEDVEEKHA